MYYQYKRTMANGKVKFCYTQDWRTATLFDANPIPCEDYKGPIENTLLGFCLGAFMVTAGLALFGPDLIGAFIDHHDLIFLSALSLVCCIVFVMVVARNAAMNE